MRNDTAKIEIDQPTLRNFKAPSYHAFLVSMNTPLERREPLVFGVENDAGEVVDISVKVTDYRIVKGQLQVVDFLSESPDNPTGFAYLKSHIDFRKGRGIHNCSEQPQKL